MKVFAPDFARRIDLPGAGPCARPIDIDRTTTGIAQLVSLRVYSFARGAAIDGEAEGDEVFIVLMRGAADIQVLRDGAEIARHSLAMAGGSRAIFLPPHAAYRLSAVTDCDIAYARSAPIAGSAIPPADFAPRGGVLRVVGHASGMDMVLRTVPAGGEVTLVAPGGGSPERIVHVRSARGSAVVAGERLTDWASAALDVGEAALLETRDGDVELLAVYATGAAMGDRIVE